MKGYKTVTPLFMGRVKMYVRLVTRCYKSGATGAPWPQNRWHRASHGDAESHHDALVEKWPRQGTLVDVTVVLVIIEQVIPPMILKYFVGQREKDYPIPLPEHPFPSPSPTHFTIQSKAKFSSL